MEYIPRKSISERIETSLQAYSVTLLLGPRQVGKSTLVRQYAPPENRLDLESVIDLSRLSPDSFGLLANMKGVVVIDEVQMMKELFQHIRVIVDDPLCQTRFLLTGSASPDLASSAAETLAGRVNIIELGGLSLNEVGPERWERLWFRGGFPRSFLASQTSANQEQEPGMLWLENYLKTFVLRDIQQWAGSRLPSPVLSRFLILLAHYHGQEWNRAEVATTLSVDVKTVDRYMNVFLEAYLLRELRPYSINIGKRLRKSPRYYFRDSGLLHCLRRIPEFEQLRANPCLGPSWEGFGIEQVIRQLGCAEEDCFYWRTHSGAEIDLVITKGMDLIGIEFKASSSPKVSRGSHTAMADLGLKRLYVVFPGPNSFEISENVLAVPVRQLSELKI